MKAETLYEHNGHQWIAFGRDPEKPNFVIDTNEYMVMSGASAMIMDPGGVEIFPEVITAISKFMPVSGIKAIFGSHQDPDILSSLSLWLDMCRDAKVYVPWVWTDFITHFGCDKSRMIPIPDEGMPIDVSPSLKVEAIPAHYLHSSGNHHIYDSQARIYFSGDVGAALVPPDFTGMFVEDFDKHIRYMEGFHRRWMPSNRARDVWIERVRPLKIDMLCPQHGAIFTGKDVERFLDWFSTLELGSAVEPKEVKPHAA